MNGKRNKLGNISWGVAFILVGVIIAGNSFGFWKFDIFFHGWWTLFIIVPCAISIIQSGPRPGNLVGLLIGILLLLTQQNIIPWISIHKMILPLIFIFIGVGFVLKDPNRHKECCDNFEHHYSEEFNSCCKETVESTGDADSAGRKTYSVCFNKRKIVYQGEQFEGANLDVIFGSIELDLRNAAIRGTVPISTSVVFGSADIYVPDNVRVEVNCLPIFGSVTNKSTNPVGDIDGVIQINGNVMFGGITIV